MITFENGVAYFGDALETVKQLQTESIDSIITSPPYYQLRDYGFEGQWGSEVDFRDYLDKMVLLMIELKRVLKPTGTMWVNLGDTYGTFRGKSGQCPDQAERNKNRGIVKNIRSKHHLHRPNKNQYDKSLMLIPHRFAIRCLDELELILRNDIIWAKPHGMPESVTDRFTKMHEFIFFFVKQKDYYFNLDGIRDPLALTSIVRLSQDVENQQGSTRAHGGRKLNGTIKACAHKNGKNPGDVADFWAIDPGKTTGNHFAIYSSELIKKPIIAGSPEGGIILDPFGGTGTTAFSSIRHGRKFIYIDGSQEYYQNFCKEMDRYDAQLKIQFPEAI